MVTRVAMYLRVSTVKQAEKDLSIPDQRNRIKEFCERKGWVIVGEYADLGRSARDDNRPEFLRMIGAALSPAPPFDAVVVHSFSRFYRDEAAQEILLRKMEANKVSVFSMTEEVGPGFGGEITRRIMGLINEVDNRQRAARVTQTMQENARQGFWNGGHAPFGFRTVVAEVRGETRKKRLEIDPREAEIVCLIYRLCLHGDGQGPMGIKTIVDYLNNKGFRYRRDRMFSVGEVHRILTTTSVMGLHHYNRKSSKTNTPHAPETWIPMTVPTIVEPDEYEAVQKHLRGRRPAVTPARLVNGAMLLTGIATCPHCGSAMGLRTGKSGRYRYYACAGAASKGKEACKGRRIRMEHLDELVLSAIEDRLLQPAHLKDLLAGLAQRLMDGQSRSEDREKALRRELRQTEDGIKRLLDALARGSLDDDDLFRGDMNQRRQRRDELIRLVAHNSRRRDLPNDLLSPKNLETFGMALRHRLRESASGLRRGYVRHMVSRVVVGEQRIEIRGSKAALLAAVAEPQRIAAGEVPTSISEWRREWDSNPRYGFP
jgi:site-specific DNA recombinase